MTLDFYAGAASNWARGAEIVYRPIAHELVRRARRPLAGQRVLDVGAGTGVASAALIDAGAQPVAVDLSHDMLAFESRGRPAAVVGDVCRLPVRDDAVDGVVAAFVLNHLENPMPGLAELIRVTRPGGTVLASGFATAGVSTTRDALDEAARREGWMPPQWYLRLKQAAVPVLGTAGSMQQAAVTAGLAEIEVDERPVDVGVTTARQLVDYRLGQAQFADWLRQLGDRRAAETRARLIAEIEPSMTPYLPVVVFLAATVALP